MERRTFLAAASAGSLLGGLLARLASAQRDPTSFQTAEIDVAGKRDTRFGGRTLSLFQARNGRRTG
jgi:hypothetical protein